MPKINCCICSRRTDTNKQRTRIGAPSFWPLVKIHAEKVNLDISLLSKDKYVCMKCHSKICHHEMSDRGPNKKVKVEPIVSEPIITKEILRGHSVLALDTILNITTDMVTDEEYSISTESVVDAEIVLDEELSILDADELSTNENEANSAIASVIEPNVFETILMMNVPTDSHGMSTITVSRNDMVPTDAEEISTVEITDFVVDENDVTTVVDYPRSSITDNCTNSTLMNQQSSMPAVESQSSSSAQGIEIQGASSTQSRCFICDSVAGRKAIPWPAIQQAWFETKCYVPKTNRTCKEHLDASNKFNEEAIQKIEASKRSINVNSNDFVLWLHEVSNLQKSAPYSFENDGIEAEKYKMFFGITKEHFDDLTQYLVGMRNTETRSIRSALAMFLLLLRNNMKQEVIAHNFSTSQQVVSKTIDAVSAALDEYFVPKYLGYRHITREEAIERHSIKLTSNVLGQSESSLCLIADCTYNYIEKPTNFELQRKTFSANKKRNLLKPLYIVLPDGYILEAAGPYYCDAKNNDAANIRHHYKNSDLLLFMEDQDYFLFDRGFRDVVDETITNGQSVFMPRLLGGKRTNFTCDEANESRKVTMFRWVIESANGRVKNMFPFFKHTIEGSYVPKIMRFNRIVCAIINKCCPPLSTNKEFHDVIFDVSKNQTSITNKLKEEIEQLGIQRMTTRWQKASEDSIHDMEDLKRITLGMYQIKTAEQYIKHHMKEDNRFGIFIHRENEDIIRAKIQSRFSKSKSHNVWVKFHSKCNGYEAIEGWYCTCKAGERSLGCCSHVTSVLRYLGYDRHQPYKPESHCRTPWDAIDCNQDSEDEDEDDEI